MSEREAPESDAEREHDRGRGLAGDLIEYGLYAPLGVAIRLAGQLPEAVQRSRRAAASRVSNARVLGRFAVEQARRRLERQLADLEAEDGSEQRAGAEAESPGSGGGGASPASVDGDTPPRRDAGGRGTGRGRDHGPARSRPGAPAGGAVAGASKPSSTAKAGAKGPGTGLVHASARGAGVGSPRGRSDRADEGADEGAGEGAGEDPPEVTALAIPNYDSLAASQVVPRLSGLTSEQLDAVRRYEAAHRRRRTVLNRVAQLQGAVGGAR